MNDAENPYTPPRHAGPGDSSDPAATTPVGADPSWASMPPGPSGWSDVPAPEPAGQPIEATSGQAVTEVAPGEPMADDADFETADETAPAGPRRALQLVGVLAAVLALVIAGTVTAWAVDRPGMLPENVLPAEGAATFVRLDYDPGVRDWLPAMRFSSNYQQAADRSPSRAPLSVGNLGWLLGPMLDGTSLTLRADVEPWAGDKAGVLVTRSGLTLVAIKLDGDEATVRTFFDDYSAQTGQRVGYAFSGGYIVVTDSTALAEEATQLAEAGGDLAGNATFDADLQRLPASRLGVVWADLGAMAPRPQDATFSARIRATVDREIGGVAGVARGALTAGSLPDQVYAEASRATVEGRLVVGLSLRSDGLALDGFVTGLTVNGQLVDEAAAGAPAPVEAETTSTGPSAPKGLFELRALPADTILAAGVQGLGGGLQALITPAVPQDSADVGGDSVVDTEAGAVASEPVGDPSADPSAANDATTEAGTDQASGAGAAGSSPAVDEALPLIGTDTAIGVLGGGGVAVRAAGTVPQDVAAAVSAATGDQIVSALLEAPDTSYITTGEVQDTTPLDNIPTFSEALPGLDDDVAVFYVNLDWATFTQDVDALNPFSAFGVGLARGDVPGEFTISGRMLIDEPYLAPSDAPVEDSAPSEVSVPAGSAPAASSTG